LSVADGFCVIQRLTIYPFTINPHAPKFFVPRSVWFDGKAPVARSVFKLAFIETQTISCLDATSALKGVKFVNQDVRNRVALFSHFH
jgi:hypothetical protein